jgi:hypothetical protein
MADSPETRGFVYRQDPVAEPRETLEIHGGASDEDLARRAALQTERLARAGMLLPDFRDTLRIRQILPAVESTEVVDDREE